MYKIVLCEKLNKLIFLISSCRDEAGLFYDTLYLVGVEFYAAAG